MGQHCIVSNDNSVGTTIGTFDPVNSRNTDVRLTAGTNLVHGIAVNVARAARTSATAMMLRLRVTSADLGVAAGAADFLLGDSSGGDTATANQASFTPVEWIATEWSASGGNILNYSASQAGIEPGDNFEIQVGTAHMVPPGPSSLWFTLAAVGGVLPHHGSVSSDGGSTTAARTTLTALTIPATYTKLVSLRPIQSQDGIPATTEAGTAFVDLATQGTTIGSFTPQEYPTNGMAGILGTAAASTGPCGTQPRLPLWFVKARQTETVEAFVTGLDTLSAANAYGYGIGLQR